MCADAHDSSEINFYVKLSSLCTTIWRGQSTNAYMNMI
jgi:hypothetical protein